MIRHTAPATRLLQKELDQRHISIGRGDVHCRDAHSLILLIDTVWVLQKGAFDFFPVVAVSTS